jgi:hypothetical protein
MDSSYFNKANVKLLTTIGAESQELRVKNQDGRKLALSNGLKKRH